MTRSSRGAGLHAAAGLVLVALTLAACGIPTGSPTAIAKADVPFHLLTPTTIPTATTAPSVGVPESIYLVAPDQHVSPVSRDVALPSNSTLTDTIDAAITALLDGPTAADTAAGLQTFLVTGSKPQVSTTITGTTATIDFTANPVPAGPNQTLAVAQIVFTATQFGINLVSFEIGGSPVQVPTAGGANVAGPVSRLSYLPQAPVS